MPKYEVTFVERYVIEMPDLSDATRKYLIENYETSLPFVYQDSEYLDGQVTFEEMERNE